MIFDWITGRSLSKITKGNTEIDMMYDCNGMRTQKEIGDDVTKYYYDSSNNLIGLTNGNNTLFFYYDNNGTPTSFAHNGTMYYYVKNLQGDIVQITKQDGTVVAKYIYDVWGKILSIKDGSNNTIDSTNATHLANLNPFRYRGYVYDSETGFYYLKSRYYDPETGRFINADIYCDTMTSIFGTNMFTYCNNNPVNQVDPEGTDAYWLQFGDAVNIGPFTFGHTSLLLQDASNNWWYFYWGPKHAILRPCGKDSFTSFAELNSYLTGFDPRPHHNYYVYATNVIEDSEDINYSAGSDYYLKCHDKAVTDWIYFLGSFTESFAYAKDLLTDLYVNSNATQLLKKVYENGKATYIYDVCAKVSTLGPGMANPDEAIPSLPSGYYYSEIKLNSNYTGNIKNYDVFSYNCVQVSMDILLEGTFSGSYHKYYNKLCELRGSYFIFEWVRRDVIPNVLYDKLKKV